MFKNLFSGLLISALISAQAFGAGSVLKGIAEVRNGSGILYVPTVTPTASRACVLDAGSAISSATTTSTEIGYINGLTSAVQTQLNAKQTTTLADGSFLLGNSSNVATAVALSGDVTSTNAGVTAIGNTKVTNAMLAGSITSAKLVSSDITTLGTIGTGVWNATVIALSKINPFVASFAIPTMMYPGASNVTDTTGGLVSVTGMSFAIAASEVWAFECWMQTQCNNTGGILYGINGPSGSAVRAMAQGASTGITAQTSAVISALNTVTAVAFNTVSSAGGRSMISGTMTNGATPGTWQLQFAAGVSTQTATIFKESFCKAYRVL